jgi:predicted Zn-dependent peptidase
LYEKTTLPNGLRIVTATMPHTRSAAVQFYIGVGARHERPEISGISHFVEHMVFKGTARRPNPVQISEAVEGVGGSLDAATDHEHTNYRALVPYTYFSTAAEVLTDMLRNPAFAPGDIEKERAVIIEEISSTFDSPGEIVELVFDEMLWDGHPLGKDVAGSKQSVRRIKRAHLVEHVQANYTPASIIVSVAGNVTHEEVVNELEHLWGDMPAHTGTPRSLNPPAPVTESLGPRVMTFRKRTEQTNLILGVPALPYTHPDRFTQDVLDALLGSGMSSRLFVEVRENRGLAYSVSSFTRTFPDVGAFGVHAAVDNGTVVAAIEAIMSELRRVRDTDVPEVELRKVKEFIKGHTLLSLERSGYVAHWAGWQELMLNRIDTVDEVLERIEAVTAWDVRSLAQRLFTTDKLHLALVGPAKSDEVFFPVLQMD